MTYFVIGIKTKLGVLYALPSTKNNFYSSDCLKAKKFKTFSEAEKSIKYYVPHELIKSAFVEEIVKEVN